jgi:methylphosphotriester-DNA--protein-cysteine methyltransferase
MFKRFFSSLILGMCLVSFSSVGLSEEAKVYVGSRNSNKYHYTWCGSARRIKPNNRVVFDSVKEAKSYGYIPCKVCKPPLKD